MKRLWIILSALAVLSVACGKLEHDPKKDFPGYENTVQAHNAQPQSQSYTSPEAVSVIADNDMNFVEGQSSQFKILARVFDNRVSYDLTIHNLPAGATVEKSATEPYTWLLTWKPPLGTVPEGLCGAESDVLDVAITNIQTDDIRVERMMRNVKRTFQVPYSIRRTDEPPVIVAVDVPAKVQAGASIPFTVKLLAAGTNQFIRPRLDVYFKSALGAGRLLEANGASFVRPDGQKDPTFDAETGTWTFYYEFDTKNAAIPDQLDLKGERQSTAQELKTRFTLKAYTPNGASSPEHTHRVSIEYQAQAPTINMAANDKQLTFQANGFAAVTFMAIIPDLRGSVSFNVEELKESVKGWKGNAQVNCEAGSSYIQKCFLSWQAPCESASYKLKIKATNTLSEQQTKVSEIVRTFSVKGAANCKSAEASSKNAKSGGKS